MLTRITFASLVCLAAACSKHAVQGSGLVLNMQPTPPSFAGAYDFDLLDAVRGRECLREGGHQLGGSTISYWVSGAGLDSMATDSRSAQAIAAAAFKIIDTSNADSILMTRVVVESKGEHEVCATVYGRAVRLKKAISTPIEQPGGEPETSDDAEGSDADEVPETED